MSRQHVWILGAALAGMLIIPAALTMRTSAPSTPERTIQTFLRAAASGDAKTACAQLSPAAKREVVQGASCETGIELGASMYGSIIGQLKVTDLKTTGNTATGASTLSGQQTATFQLARKDGKWLIAHEQRVQAAAAAGTKSPAPSQARVEAVAQCLDKEFGVVDNAGLDSTGGVPHAVLGVDVDGYSAAEVDVFASALAATAGYPGIKSYQRGLTTTIAGGSVFVYLKALSTDRQRTLEACG